MKQFVQQFDCSSYCISRSQPLLQRPQLLCLYHHKYCVCITTSIVFVSPQLLCLYQHKYCVCINTRKVNEAESFNRNNQLLTSYVGRWCVYKKRAHQSIRCKNACIFMQKKYAYSLTNKFQICQTNLSKFYNLSNKFVGGLQFVEQICRWSTICRTNLSMVYNLSNKFFDGLQFVEQFQPRSLLIWVTVLF